MATIVGGFATSHVLFPPDEVEVQAETVFAGMMAIRARIAALKPDIIILAGSDHLNNFSLATQVTLGIGVADSWCSFGDSGLPLTPYPGHREAAEAIARHAAIRGFDLVQIEEARPDHGMTIARFIVDPSLSIPTIPLWINSVMPIPPSPARCLALGGVVREAIQALRPEGERIVIVGHGGLSHWLSVEGMGRINVDFDRYVMERITSGNAADFAALTAAAIAREAGNGGLEMVSWLFMAGALPGADGEILYYEPILPWISGMGGLALMPR